jgi:hypothetical protein
MYFAIIATVISFTALWLLTTPMYEYAKKQKDLRTVLLYALLWWWVCGIVGSRCSLFWIEALK